MENQKEELLCERAWVYRILMTVGGFYGGYTYCVRGGVFCNAQTANFVLMSMAIGRGQWKHALYYLIPMSAYLLGAVLSEDLPKKVRLLHIRWETMQVLIETVMVLVLGFLPVSVPHQIAQITINFVASMRYNTFRKADGIAMSTTFCTNHVRQTGIAIVHLLHHPGRNAWLTRLVSHASMLGTFLLGGILATFFSDRLSGRSIWVMLPLLLFLDARLLYADLKTEKDRLDEVPAGH